MDISRLKEQENKNRDQWLKVLGTFDLIKDKPSINKRNPAGKPSTRKKQIIHKTREATQTKKSQGGTILSSILTNTIYKTNCSQNNFIESGIVLSSLNEESNSCLGNTILNKRTDISKRKGNLIACHEESIINWSSSNESENEENESLNNKNFLSSCKYLKRKHDEFKIDWSSSNESENEGKSTQKSRLGALQNQVDSEYELDSFVREIEKDLRRTKKIKQKLTIKKGGYVDSFRKAVNKAKADTGFLDYEQRAEIICGYKGIVSEREVSYGSCLANVQLETSSKCYIFLGKNMNSCYNGNALFCFLDDSRCYTVNDKNVYVQPNKVIRA